MREEAESSASSPPLQSGSSLLRVVDGHAVAGRTHRGALAHDCDERLAHSRIALASGTASELPACHLDALRGSVGPPLRHRTECVRGADDPRLERDLLPDESIWIAGAVEALMGCSDELRDLAERGGGGDDAFADDGVLPDQLPFVIGEGSGLVEHDVWDGRLAE